MRTNLMLLFLAQNNLLDKFIANCEKQNKIEYVNNNSNLCLMITFTWHMTEEGHDFWSKLDNEYVKFEKSFQ